MQLDIAQPDGASFKAFKRGDEWKNWIENDRGYAISRDDNGYWRYVTRFDGRKAVLGTTRADREPPGFLLQHSRPRPSSDHPQRASEGGEESLSTPLMAPSPGSVVPVLFILADFDNLSGSTSEASWGNFVTNNIADYFDAASYGNLTITPASENSGIVDNGVVGWVNIGRRHPATNDTIDTRNQQLTADAILVADPYVNFAAYDNNGDGFVDADELSIVVIVAGNEAAYDNTTPAVWAHKWSLSTAVTADGVKVGGWNSGAGGYAQFGEKHATHQATMGVMVHELGHLILGLPDLYDTDGSSYGIGAWGLMSGGSWGASSSDTWAGETPVLMSAWSQYVLDWVSPAEAGGLMAIMAAGSSSASSMNSVIRASTQVSNEYYLFQNRQNLGYDSGLERYLGAGFPGGLAIWHIDDSLATNSDDSHRLVDLEEADGTEGYGSNSDLWYEGGSTEFDETTSPSSTMYSGSSSDVVINSISLSREVMELTAGDVLATIPLQLDSEDPAERGWFYGTSQHRESIVFTFESTDNDRWLHVTGYDIDHASEVCLYLNDTLLTCLPPGPDNGLTVPQEILVPQSGQVAGTNRLAFRQIRPGYKWGVTAVGLYSSASVVGEIPLQLDSEDPAERGWFYGTSQHRESIVFTFESTDGDRWLHVTGYDIDHGSEVCLYLNDTPLTCLPPGSDNGLTVPQEILVPQSGQVAGTNRLEFRQIRPGYKWGVTAVGLYSSASVVDEIPLYLDSEDPAERGWFYGTSQHRESIVFTFESTGSDRWLHVTGFDIDHGSEVCLYLNDTPLTCLPPGPDNGLTVPQEILVPQSGQFAGTNRLAFRQIRPGYKWGVTAVGLYSSASVVGEISLHLESGDPAEHGLPLGASQLRKSIVSLSSDRH